MIKKLIAFSCTTALACTLGFFLPDEWMRWAFHHLGYYFMLIVFLIWGGLTLNILDKNFFTQMRQHAFSLAAAFIMMSLIFHISPPEFKILADETNLVSVSMAMHQTKTASMPIQGFAIEYFPFDYEQTIDARPLLFPFLVSLCHGLLGYSPYNGMIVNFICGVGILFFMSVLISLVFSSRLIGFAAMLIMASCPIFVFWVTSSGFETTNLFFISIVLLTLFLFLRYQDVEHAELVLFSSVLLANCRYESFIFVFTLILLSPYLLKTELLKKYRFPVFFIPLAFLPLIWQRQITFLDSLVRGDKGLQAPEIVFGVKNFINNFSSNVFVITGLNADFGFLPLIFIFSASGIYLILKRYTFQSGTISTTNKAFGTYVFASAILLFTVYTSFYWGRFTTDIDNRLAMSLLPFIILAAAYCLSVFLHHRRRFASFLTIFLLFIQMLYYWPVGAENHLLNQNAPYYANKRITHYLYKHHDMKKEKILLISDRPNFFIIHGLGSIGFQMANQNLEKLRYFKNIYYDDIIVLQKCNPITGAVKLDNQLSGDFQLLELKRINVSPDYYLRISRLQD